MFRHFVPSPGTVIVMYILGQQVVRFYSSVHITSLIYSTELHFGKTKASSRLSDMRARTCGRTCKPLPRTVGEHAFVRQEPNLLVNMQNALQQWVAWVLRSHSCCPVFSSRRQELTLPSWLCRYNRWWAGGAHVAPVINWCNRLMISTK